MSRNEERGIRLLDEAGIVLTALCLVLLFPATAVCLYYFLPVLLSSPRRECRPEPGPSSRTFLILVPAHNEAATLPHLLESIRRLNYPVDRFRVCVVADNCTDRTAAIAGAAGAMCLVRQDADRRGKGQALAYGLRHLGHVEADVVLVVDADCELNCESLRALDAAFANGAEVVQSAVRFGNADAGLIGYVAAVGAAVDARVAAALGRLGCSVPLRGMGMAFHRSVLDRVPWEAFSIVEDAEYDARLRRAGIRVHYCESAVVTTAAPESTGDLDGQRQRWRAALRPSRWFESKPLVLLQLFATAILCAIAGAFVMWAAVLVLLTVAVYIRAMCDLGFSWKRLGYLLSSPWIIARLGWIGIAGGVRSHPIEWVRTPRLSRT